MFRALAALSFIVVILPLAALAAALVMRVLDLDGVLGFIVGFPIFIGLLTAAVMVLAAINDRLNSGERYRETRRGTRIKGAH